MQGNIEFILFTRFRQFDHTLKENDEK